MIESFSHFIIARLKKMSQGINEKMIKLIV